jgi:uncharacterized protein (DUF2267 family)
MMTSKDPVPAELDIVRSFLRKYYFDEEWEDRAAIRALQAHTDNLRERWRVANAFDRVLAAELPAGLLEELVWTSANRDLPNNEEAREFLERVYASNGFDGAVDFDEFH